MESIAALHAYQTSQQVITSLRSKLYCGSENNSNLTAVMSGLPSSQHTQDLTKLCSSKYDEDPVMWAIITRSLDDSRCVEPSEGRFKCNTPSRTVEATATDDEENAAENLMMIQDCQARDANISRLQLVV